MKKMKIILILCLFIPIELISGEHEYYNIMSGNRFQQSTLFNSPSFGENSKLGGLVFGFGVGPGMSMVAYEGTIYDGPNYEKPVSEVHFHPCLSTNFRIGYAPSESFFICWNSRTNWFKSFAVSEYDETESLTGGGAGLGITFLPSRNMENIYVNGSWGYSNIFKSFNRDRNNFGTLLSLGVGYLMINHLGFEINFQVSSSDKYHYGGEITTPFFANFTFNYLLWK